MLLKAKDRLVLSVILSRKHQDSVASLKILRKFREELSFTEKEFKALEMKEGDNDMITWNEKADKGKEVAISDVVNGIIKRRLQELDREKQMNEDWLDIYDKFMEEKKEEA